MSKRDDEYEPKPLEMQRPDLPLNPDFNFWENRGAHDQASQQLAEVLNERQKRELHSGVDTIAPESPEPPDASHTLLRRGRWVRPWGLRNFGYSLVAFVGVQIVVTLIITFVVIGQQVAAGVDPTSLDSTALTQKSLALLQIPGWLIFTQFSGYAVWLGYMWWATRFRGLRSWAKDFGFWFKKRDVLIGIASAVGLLGLETGVTALLQALLPKANYSGMDNGAIFSNQSGVAFFLVGIGVAGIVGPICEELYFRGFFLTGIRRWLNRYVPGLGAVSVSAIAIIVSSIVFGLFHFQGDFNTFGKVLVVLYTGGIGVVLAIYRVAFKRLGPGIATHISFNTIGLLLTFFAVGGN